MARHQIALFGLLFCGLHAICTGQMMESVPAPTYLLRSKSPSFPDSCLYACMHGECGNHASDGAVVLATKCDQRRSQLWFRDGAQWRNFANDLCLDVVESRVQVSNCSQASASQAFTWQGHGPLATGGGLRLSVCPDNGGECGGGLEHGELRNVYAAEDTGSDLQDFIELAPETRGVLVRSKWLQSKLHGWCLHRCCNGDCGDSGKDGNVIITERCDERINQLWYSDGSTIRSAAPDGACLAGCRVSGSGANSCSGGGVSVQNNVNTVECDGTDYQNWDWKAVGKGSSWVLKNRASGGELTVCDESWGWCNDFGAVPTSLPWDGRNVYTTLNDYALGTRSLQQWYTDEADKLFYHPGAAAPSADSSAASGSSAGKPDEGLLPGGGKDVEGIKAHVASIDGKDILQSSHGSSSADQGSRRRAPAWFVVSVVACTTMVAGVAVYVIRARRKAAAAGGLGGLGSSNFFSGSPGTSLEKLMGGWKRVGRNEEYGLDGDIMEQGRPVIELNVVGIPTSIPGALDSPPAARTGLL